MDKKTKKTASLTRNGKIELSCLIGLEGLVVVRAEDNRDFGGGGWLTSFLSVEPEFVGNSEP